MTIGELAWSCWSISTPPPADTLHIRRGGEPDHRYHPRFRRRYVIHLGLDDEKDVNSIPGCLPLETDRSLGRNYGFGLIGFIPVLNTVFWITMWTKLIKKLPAANNRIIRIKNDPKIFIAIMFIPVLNLFALGYLAFSIGTKQYSGKTLSITPSLAE